MKLKKITQKKNLEGLKVLLRVDFNVPLVSKKITEDYRISAAIPSIKYLLNAGASIIIISHWGDPKKRDLNYSTKKLAKRLEKLSGLKVGFVDDIVGDKAVKKAKNLKAKEIIFLENLRFEAGEKKNDKKFAKKLADLADIYVNDAFSVSHRDQASVSAVSNFLPAYAGLQLEAEIINLEKIIKPKKPLVLLMGGSKIATKAPMIKKLQQKSKYILIGGALANNFLKYKKYEIGKSMYDAGSTAMIASLLKDKKLMKKIILPIDVIVKDSKKLSRRRKLEDIKKTDTILDIGPDTISLFSSYIREAQTIVWNGPLGKFEESPYKHGTIALASVIAIRSTGPAFGLVGGGETVSALKLTKMESHVDWLSTAGGAMLAYLGAENMPGLKNIILKK